MRILILFTLILSFFACQKEPQKSKPDIDQRVETLLSNMTLEEKVGQMTQVNITVVAKQDDATNLSDGVHALDQEKLKHIIVDCHVGSILNALEGRKNMQGWHEVITDIQDMATQQTKNKIPVLFGVDAIHGATYLFGSTLFPHNIGIAATRNPEFAYQCAQVTAMETRATGVPWNFDPVFDIGRQPLWPRFPETFGEDVKLVTDFGVAAVKGYEDRGVNDKTGVASCIKHFVGYSNPTSGWDRTPSLIPERELRTYYLPQFKAAINAGAKTLMINSGEVNGIPTHCNKYLLIDVLRGELGFEGLAVSDWQDIIYLHTKHKVAKDLKEAVEMAVMSGVDMSMTPMDVDFYHLLIELVKEGSVPMSRIDEANRRILKMKFELGLFENPYPDPEALKNFKKPEYKQMALDAARESMTLLKNDNLILPIQKGSKIILAGPGANNKSSLHGCWSYSWQGNEEEKYPSTTPTIKDEFERVLGKENVFCRSVSKYESKVNHTLPMIPIGEEVDYVVLCLGENAYAETPGGINELDLSQWQQFLVEDAQSLGVPIVIILTEGRPRLISKIEPMVDGILMAYWPSEMGAQAIVETIIGENNPSGKLPFVYPKFSGYQLTYDCKFSNLGDSETQGGYRFDGYRVQYDFGHGLSYSTFEYGEVKLDRDTISRNDSLTITLDVINTSDIAGKHTVELFTRDLVASVTPEWRKLRDYEKIDLKPGERSVVTFKLHPQQLRFVGLDNQWTLEEGDFEIMIGDQVKRFYLKL